MNEDPINYFDRKTGCRRIPDPLDGKDATERNILCNPGLISLPMLGRRELSRSRLMTGGL
jgi:hypothetical protein